MHDNLVKRCTYCGKEHPAEAEVCSLDGQPLIDSRQKEDPPASSDGDKRSKLMVGFVVGVLGFLILSGIQLKFHYFNLKLVLITFASLIGGVICLVNLIEHVSEQLIERSAARNDNAAPSGNSSAGPLRCTYCGKRHPEGTEVCDLDAQPLRRV